MLETPDPSTTAPESDPTNKAAPPPIGRPQKIINYLLWGILAIVVVGMVASKFVPTRHAAMHILFHTPAFVLTDQDGKSFSDVDLRGKAYICDFIFTTCGSACPMMSQKLAGVQKQTPAELQLVSFTVNPEHDTPAVLKAYAATYGADLSRWHFLTGTPVQMTTTVRAMNIAVTPATDHDPIGHSEKFLLVDGDGNVRGIYDSNDDKSMRDLIIDSSWLATTPGGTGW